MTKLHKPDNIRQKPFFLEKEDDPGLCIWKMYTVTLLIILEDLTKCYNNKPESTN